jgi:Cu+-exporting ATPase
MSQHHHTGGHSGSTAMVVDPVCGMTVDPGHAAGSFTHRGTTYYFCSVHCRA